jgi:hypothetical protein
MKKLFILSLFVCVLLCGCTPVQDLTMDEIINRATNRNIEVYNTYRKGYKYNLPNGLDTIDNSEYNEVIASSKYKYYLYIDAVSYHNKVIEKYDVNDTSYLSKAIDYEDKYGYLEINKLKDNKYLIEIMYNYAKIEVIVNGEDIKVVVSNALNVLTSVKFNDKILDYLLNEEVANFKEYEFDIFETVTTMESDYLEAVENDIYEEDEGVRDSDLIN